MPTIKTLTIVVPTLGLALFFNLTRPKRSHIPKGLRPVMFNPTLKGSQQTIFHSALVRCLPLAVAMLLVSVNPARATVVFGNLGNDGMAELGSYAFGGISPARAAQGMTTGTTQLSIESIKLGLDRASSGTGDYAISIFNDVEGLPGAAVATTSPLSVSQNPSFEGSIYEFTFSTPVALQPLTTYWIVPPTDLNWFANSTDGTPSGLNGSGYTFFNTATNTSGDTWVADSFGGSAWAVSVNAVPEPSAALLLVLGLVAVTVRRRARRR